MHGHLCLCIHCIRRDGSPEPCAHRELFIGVPELEALFGALKNEGYRFALPGEAAEVSGPVCSVTFDDGYYNNRHFLETAERHNIPFILFFTSYEDPRGVPATASLATASPRCLRVRGSLDLSHRC